MTTPTKRSAAGSKKAGPPRPRRPDRDDKPGPDRSKPNEDLKARAQWFQQRRGDKPAD